MSVCPAHTTYTQEYATFALRLKFHLKLISRFGSEGMNNNIGE